jgi:hypothetical protein
MARSSVDLHYFQGLISAAVMDLSKVHLDLDNAWREIADDLPRIDATKWGPRLRFSTSPRAVEQFYREIGPRLGKFILYGSGDFHHLTALWLRRMHEPITLVSPAALVLRRLDQSRAGAAARQACRDLGLRKFRVLVAAPAFRQSQSGTLGDADRPSVGGRSVVE